MEIIFTKGRDKRDTLKCKRTDGSATWTKEFSSMVVHDLYHYVVETTLGMRNAFFGYIEQGIDLGDFEVAHQKKKEELKGKNLQPEAQQAEFIVGLLQMEAADKQIYPDFEKILADILSSRQINYPAALNSSNLEEIRQKITSLLQEWEQIPSGETLRLVF